MSSWKILRTTDEWELHYLMNALFPQRTLCVPLSELCQDAAVILIRTETDPGLVAGFTHTLCVANGNILNCLRTRKPG